MEIEMRDDVQADLRGSAESRDFPVFRVVHVIYYVMLYLPEETVRHNNGVCWTQASMSL